jgi:allantoicase
LLARVLGALMTDQLPAFLDLPDLANEDLGGATLLANDDFFAAKENLIKPHAAEWKEHAYVDTGKWMDGWETRRRREPGYDWCVVRLGLPGVIRGVVIDTAYFRGNYPAEASLEACETDSPLDVAALASATWTEILPRAALQGNHQNRFEIGSGRRWTHVRLNIFPDGGVARLRVHGNVAPNWARLQALGGPIDLAALANGAWVESCSDMFFGSRNNLIKPGPSRSMADGWETRRRRGPGNDWAIVRLATPGQVEALELDTTHFKGNAPGRCEVEGCVVTGEAGATSPWRLLLASPLQPHTRHQFADELRRIGEVTHLRLSVFPDGGVARLRAWGNPAAAADVGLGTLAALPAAEAAARLLRCCGSTAWAAQMAALRPFEDAPALLRAADRVWWSQPEAAWLEAFAAHPQIGEQKGGAWSASEQRAAASAEATVLAQLASAQAAYATRHGFIYIVCASGRGAEDILADVSARIGNPREIELRTAAEEQAKITRLRLRKLLIELAGGGS